MPTLTHHDLPVTGVPDSFELAQALLGDGKRLEFHIGFEGVPPEKSLVRVIDIERLPVDSMWFVRVVGEIQEAGMFEWESTASRIVIDCRPGKDGICSISDWPSEDEPALNHYLSIGPDEMFSEGGYFVRLYYKGMQVGLLTETGGGKPIPGAVAEAAAELRRLLPSHE